MKRRSFCGWILFFVWIFTLGLHVGATEDDLTHALSGDQTARSAYTLEYDPLVQDEDWVYLDRDFAGDWRVQNEGVRVIRQSPDGLPLLRLSVRTSFSGESIALRHADMTRLDGNNMLVIPLVVDDSTEAAERNTYNVRVTMELLDGSCVAESVVEANQWQALVVDVSEFERIESITVAVSWTDVKPGTIRFAPLYMIEGDDFKTIAAYMTPSFRVTGGTLLQREDHCLIQTAASTTSLEGKLVIPDSPEEGTRAFLLVTLSGEVENGSLIVGFRNGGEGAQYDDSVPMNLRDGQYVYAFPFVAGQVTEYRLMLHNATYSGDGIVLESVSVLQTEDRAEPTDVMGYVSSVSLNRYDDGTGGRLVISGRVSQTVMAAHSKDELVLYAVPYAEAHRVGETSPALWGGEELARSKIYMNFELILDGATTARTIGTHMFYLTIEGGEHERLLLAPPKGVDYGGTEWSESSVVGISGASAVGTFESNASHVIVELPFHRLVVGEDAADGTVAVTTANGTVIHLNETLLRELSAEVSFYASANMEVYLGMTNGDTALIDSVSAMDTSEMELCAAVLARLFTMDGGAVKDAVSGFILGEPRAYTVEDLSEKPLYEFTRKLSELMRVIYSTAYFHKQEAVGIILPVRVGGNCNDLMVRMLAVHTKETGGVPWFIMNVFSAADKDAVMGYTPIFQEGALLLETARNYGIENGAVGQMYTFEPNAEDTAEGITVTYNNLCEAAEGYDPRVIFLATGGVTDEKKELLYRQLKTVRRGEKNSIIENIAAEILSSDEDVTAEGKAAYTVWDFGGLYYTDGWLAGGTVSGCTTERSEIFSVAEGRSTRALRTVVTFDNEYSMAGAIVLRNFNMRTDLTEVDDMILRFSVAETTETATVIFIVGNEAIRAEYALNDVAPGRVYTVRCPISEYSGRGDAAYIGVMVYSADEAVLEIASVQMTSDALSPTDVAGLFAPSAPTEAPRSNVWLVIAGIFGVISAFVLAAMIRRDREEAEERGEAAILRGKHTHENRRRMG